MNIKARFTCLTVNKSEYCEEVFLTPVTTCSDDDPNKSYSEATPSGELKMSITNRNAWGAFEPGKDYDLDITPTAEPAD